MRVPVGVRVGVFALIVMGGYTYFANSIPQIASKPPQELSLEGGNVTPAQLVKAGEEIFHTMVWKISSPAFTSCAGVTLPPSSESSCGGLDAICGMEFAKYV